MRVCFIVIMIPYYDLINGWGCRLNETMLFCAYRHVAYNQVGIQL